MLRTQPNGASHLLFVLNCLRVSMLGETESTDPAVHVFVCPTDRAIRSKDPLLQKFGALWESAELEDPYEIGQSDLCSKTALASLWSCTSNSQLWAARAQHSESDASTPSLIQFGF